MIAVLAEWVVGGGTLTGVLEAFFGVSNEMECAEYLLNSRAYGRASSLVSIDPFRAFSGSKKSKSNEGESPQIFSAGSFVKKEAGNPLELKSDSTLTIDEHGQRFYREVKVDGRELTKVPQTPPKVKAADDRDDCSCYHEQVTCHRDAGEKWPGLEYVSEHGASQHSRPQGKEVRVKHSKEDERPFDFSEYGKPALHKELVKRKRKAKEGTYGYSPWSENLEGTVSLAKQTRSGKRCAYHSEDKE